MAATYRRRPVSVADAGNTLCFAGLDVPRVGSIDRPRSLSHHLHSQEEGKGTRGSERKGETEIIVRDEEVIVWVSV